MAHTKSKQQLASGAIPKAYNILDLFFYHAYSIWLFTYSDLHIILFPETAFGILHALWFIKNGSYSAQLTSQDVVKRIPLVSYWVWINLPAFNIGNQRAPESIAEDKYNKPWRPMPSGRWTLEMASYAHKLVYLTALTSSWFIGGLRPCQALVILGFWHNDCGGGNDRVLTSNFLNALGFTSFGLGALEVALGRPLDFTTPTLLDLSVPHLEQWILVLFFVIISTIQFQDMYDQEGDKSRGRNTLPLQIGDAPARWINAALILPWGILCPLFWRCNLPGYAISTSIACTIAFRTYFLRTAKQDRMTFVLWSVWTIVLYTLPLEQLLLRNIKGVTVTT